jgi:hypothetical protein
MSTRGKITVSLGSKAWPVNRAENLTAICEPTLLLSVSNINNNNNNNNYVVLVRERTISTERPLLVGEASVNVCR